MITLEQDGTMIFLEKDLDLCPICGASGMAPCAEEDGQYVLDHWGRPPMDAPPEAFRQSNGLSPRGETLPRTVAA